MNATDRGFVVPPPAIVSLPVAGTSSHFPIRRVYCVGRNYVEHIREMKAGDERDPPFFFQKPRDAILQADGTMPYPPRTANLHHEIELVVALATGGRDIQADAALDHVFGYAVGLDMTRRDRQIEMRDRKLPWEAGKAFDCSAPCGQIHPVAAIGHRLQGAITLAVNNVQRQKGDLSEMIWNVPEIIAKLSQDYALEAGDLIMTGTPAGVGAVAPGDVLTGTIEGLGAITVTIGSGAA